MTVSGIGYWSGQDITVELRPAATDVGLVFVRDDLPVPRRIHAVTTHRVVTPRRTTLTENGAAVEMVEHVLAALFGLRVDNCEIHVSHQEMPAFDGSSKSLVKALLAVGMVEQPAARRQYFLDRVLRIGDEDAWIEARPARTQGLTIRYELDYGPGPIGRQEFELSIQPETFARELAPARTFLLQAEAEALTGPGPRSTHDASRLADFRSAGFDRKRIAFCQ